MTGLNDWLQQATRRLAKDSVAGVRAEIEQHYEAAREASIANGATAGEADQLALRALGDPKVANREYRQVLLTSAEASMLRDLNWEARGVCSRPWLKRLLPELLALLALAAALSFAGRTEVARDLLVAAIGMSPGLAGPVLPIFTPARSRIFRAVKWAAIAAAIVLVSGPELLKWSWLLFSCMWPTAWTEWTRASIRRKLPATVWPKHLYL